MKTIVIDARNKSLGSGRYTARLVEYLQRVDTNLSHRYKILVRQKDVENWNLSSKRFEKVVVKARRYSLSEQLVLAARLYWLRPSLVHFTSAAQPLLYFGKSITTVQELTSLRFNTDTKRYKFKAWLHKMAVRKTPHLIVPSEYTKDDIARYAHINSRKIEVIPQGGDVVSGTSKKIPDLENKRYICYVGQGYAHKNLQVLVEAYQELKTTEPDLVLVFAGKLDSGYRKLQRYIAKQEIEGVLFTDYIEDAELKWLYEHTEAYVFPSLSEGFGLPGLEAMAHGAPVVSSDATCLPEVYGKAAEYFNPEDVREMAMKIGKVLNHPEVQKRLIQEGKQRAAKYSWQQMAEQTLAAYKNSLKEA